MLESKKQPALEALNPKRKLRFSPEGKGEALGGSFLGNSTISGCGRIKARTDAGDLEAGSTESRNESLRTQTGLTAV